MCADYECATAIRPSIFYGVRYEDGNLSEKMHRHIHKRVFFLSIKVVTKIVDMGGGGERGRETKRREEYV